MTNADDDNPQESSTTLGTDGDPIKFGIEDRGEFRSVEAFIKDLFRLRQDHEREKLWFRGHAKHSYKLMPSIGRPHPYAGRSKHFDDKDERELLHRFRRRAYPLQGRILDVGEALFVARHHGLPTRLLDWTANPLFAIYFAAHEHMKESGQLWAFRRVHQFKSLDAFNIASTQTEEKLFDRFPSNLPAPQPDKPTDHMIRMIDPYYNSARILAQDGAFTIQSDRNTAIEDCAGALFHKGNLDIHSMFRWSIPHKAKRTIIEELGALGITHRTVFPDLDGIARSIWETEVLWRGTDTIP